MTLEHCLALRVELILEVRVKRVNEEAVFAQQTNASQV